MDFPQPVRPTIATYSPALIFRDRSFSTYGILFSYRKEIWLISILPESPDIGSRSSLTSGSAFRIGSAISSTGRMDATEIAIPASAVKAPMTRP